MKTIHKTLMTALMVLLFAVSSMGATPDFVKSPDSDVVMQSPVLIDGHGTGFIPPTGMTGDYAIPYPALRAASLPTVWD